MLQRQRSTAPLTMHRNDTAYSSGRARAEPAAVGTLRVRDAGVSCTCGHVTVRTQRRRNRGPCITLTRIYIAAPPDQVPRTAACNSRECQLQQAPQRADFVAGALLQEPTAAEVEEGMPYTRSCLQESLRKYSIVPLVVRVAIRDTELLGHRIPKGTKCSLMVSSTHQLWQDPQEFRPERFMPGGEFDQFPEDTRRCDAQHPSPAQQSAPVPSLSKCMAQSMAWRGAHVHSEHSMHGAVNGGASGPNGSWLQAV